ncbi:hypothetical protein INQ24_30340, partial [Escherichia coli]|nr:hypothetical protein [Escherichia coli]
MSSHTSGCWASQRWLRTSAVDSRRGVVRLHPNAIAALGIREWDAVSLTGSRTTAAVAGLAAADTAVG